MMLEHRGRRPAVHDEAFLAAGTALFPGWVVRGRGGDAHPQRPLWGFPSAARCVPIGWVAGGSPAQLFSPDRHEDIWQVHQKMDFPGVVYRVSKDASLREAMATQVAFYREHINDRMVEGSGL
ncbi:hypothetical protein [Actinomadura logoneensis]|uniref:hypothetical protein n=1 Tax=Actinomadura logoneensis TaxID=2293572 RepID=UPI0011C0DDCF|nr:hypothetical protein [Actinomadura logoneensis]